MKIIFLDCETTGLDPRVNGLIQIAAFKFETNAGELKPLDNFYMNIAPLKYDLITPEALEANNIPIEDLKNFTPPHEAYELFKNFLRLHCDRFNKKDKYIFAGYNARFDYDFCRAWFDKIGDNFFGSYFHFPPIDVMNLAGYKLQTVRDLLTNFKLKTVCEFMNLTDGAENWHDAETDIKMTIKLYKRLGGINGN